jgi:predicted RNA-binding protein with PIN domain
VPYIVDGNNVMGQTVGWHRDKSGSRRALLKRVAAFARARNSRVTVVFDGASDRGAPEGSAVQGVKVLYARPGSDADSRIEDIVDTSPNPRGLTVVTSDRHLAFLVRSRGAKVIRSGDFRRELDSLADRRSERDDPEQIESSDVNAWLRYFGSLPENDDEPDSP